MHRSWPALRLICLFCLSCLVCPGCGPREPADRWETVELGTAAEFRDIFFLDASNGWIVGAAGVAVPGGILGRTRDGGRTWEFETGLVAARSRTMSVDLNAVHFVAEQRGCLAAGSGTILATEDGGRRWKTAFPKGPVYAHHLGIDFVDQMNGWIIGRQGVIRSEDGGATWRRLEVEPPLTGNAIDMVDLERGWVVGPFGRVHRTADGGDTWVQVVMDDLADLPDNERPTLTAVHFVDAEQGWIAGYVRRLDDFEQHDQAFIFHTADGGRSWQQQLHAVESLLKDVRFMDRQQGWAVGYNVNDGTSLVLQTTDGGAVWREDKTIYGEELRALAVCEGHVWAVGKRCRELPQRLLHLPPVPVSGSS